MSLLRKEEPDVLLNGEKRIGHWVLATFNYVVLALLAAAALGLFGAGRQILVNTERLTHLEASQAEQDRTIRELDSTIHDTNGYVKGIAKYFGVKKEGK